MGEIVVTIKRSQPEIPGCLMRNLFPGGVFLQPELYNLFHNNLQPQVSHKCMQKLARSSFAEK